MSAEIVPATVEPRAAARLPAPAAPVGWPAWRQRDAVARGEIGPVELVGAHLERLAEVEPWLNAAAHVRAEAALRDARGLEARLAAGESPGPLCGVPITVKDIIATAGIPTSCCSAAFAGNVPTRDAVAVARLRSAGAIVVAKANCPEFAFGVTCSNPTAGDTRSPWGDHSPGGSSGGDAALVSAGASALGFGTDYGGSVRWPAASCGVMGLRAGVGAVARAGQLPEYGGRLDGTAPDSQGPPSPQRHFQVIGPLARCLTDLSTAFAVIAGLDPADLLTELGSTGLDGLAVGVVADLDDGPVDPDVAAALTAAADALHSAGLSPSPAAGALDGLHAAYNALRATDPLADLRAALAGHETEIGPTAAAILAAAPCDPPEAGRRTLLEGTLNRLRDRVLTQLERTPVLLAPIAPAPACDLGGRAPVGDEILDGFALMGQCRASTGLGFPVLSIPVADSRWGLPISVQVIAGPGQEALVLAVGARLEHLLGGSRQPPWLSCAVTDTVPSLRSR